ncbi:MAG: hypothetical protein ACK4M9_07550 [Anaerobacillus sp.]
MMTRSGLKKQLNKEMEKER